MWQNYFKIIGIVPGRVVVPGKGTIDFSKENVPVELCKQLFDSGFPYLELTDLGKEVLYNQPKISKSKSDRKSKGSAESHDAL